MTLEEEKLGFRQETPAFYSHIPQLKAKKESGFHTAQI
jgi:hypothetical protein